MSAGFGGTNAKSKIVEFESNMDALNETGIFEPKKSTMDIDFRNVYCHQLLLLQVVVKHWGQTITATKQIKLGSNQQNITSCYTKDITKTTKTRV